MKMRTFLILLVAFFAVCVFLCRISTTGGRWPERVDVSFAVSLTVLAVGGGIAAASLFALLQRGLSGQSLEQNLPLVIALLGGLLLFQINWGVALALGLIVAASVIVHGLGGSKGPRP
jgi:hypothetical protein